MFPEERDFGIADGPDQIRHVVRAQVKYGVDVIKILATGGVLSKGDSPGAPQYTLEEIKVAAESAHGRAQGRRARPWHEGIKNAILRRHRFDRARQPDRRRGHPAAKEHGTYLVMDIYNDDYF